MTGTRVTTLGELLDWLNGVHGVLMGSARTEEDARNGIVRTGEETDAVRVVSGRTGSETVRVEAAYGSDGEVEIRVWTG